MFDFYAITVLVGLVIYYFFLRDNTDRSDEPPGPLVWPIIGNIFHLARAEGNITQKLGNLAKKYGEIYSLKVGMKRVVVITSKEAISTVLTNEAAFGRDRMGTFHDRTAGKNLGIVTGEGEMWEKSRTWTFKNLKEFGFGKSSEMEHFVQTCSDSLISEIDAIIGTSGVLEVTQLFSSAIYTIMWQMVEGRIKPGDEDDIKMLVVKSDAFIRSRSRGSGIVNSFPFLRFVFPQTLGYNDQMAFFNSCNKVAGKLYLDAESRLKENPTSTPTNLVESFVKNFSNDAKIFCRENFQIVFQDLLIGSTDTSSSFMECVILYLISYPEVQQKIYEEIVAIQGGPGENKFITFLDRKSMPYTQAFLLELHRNAKILQNSVPRRALWDFKYKNYVIKKDTVILTDMRLYYEDKSIWQDPETFRPERFLTSNREICNAANIISFSVGKRNCPGELYANLVTFLLTTIIVGRYKLSVPVGQEKPRLDLRPGFAFKPYPFQATFTKR